MAPIRRICLATVWFTALALGVHAAVEPEGIEQRKRDVVRTSLAHLGRLEAGPALLDAAAQANALLDIRLNVSPDGPVVTLRVTGQPQCTVFGMDGREKVVVDLSDTINLRAGKKLVPKTQGIVRQIRTSLLTLEPQFVSRVVVDLSTPCTFDLTREEGTISIALKSDGRRPVLTDAEAASMPPIVEAENLQGEVSPEVKRNVETLCSSVESLRKAQRLEPTPQEALTLEAALARTQDTIRLAHATTATLLSRSRQGFEELARQQAESRPAPHLAKTEKRQSVEARISELTEEIEAVRASQVDLGLDPVTPFAVVTEAAPSAPAPPSNPPAADPEAQKPAGEQPAQGDSAQPAPPPPPEKRNAEQKPAPSGTPVVTQMKQLLSGIAAAAKSLEGSGLTTPATVEATPVSPEKDAKKPKAPKAEKVETPVFVGNPLDQIVNIDFREMDLTNVVALLAQKAGINIIAGTDLTGVVTASLKNVTLGQAIETVLRMNGLGMIEEEGIYRIVPYEEAVAAKRKITMIKLDNAKASDIKKTLEDVLKGSPEDTVTSISANESTNVLIIAGPEARVAEFEKLTKELDIAKPVTPTVTEAIKINNSEPKDLAPLVRGMLSPEIGKVAMDERSRHLVVTDMPVVLEQVRELVAQVDTPVKQVSIDAMIVDAVLSDVSQTGVDWILKLLRDQTQRGRPIGSLVGTERDLAPYTPQGPSIGVDSTGEPIQRDLISNMQTFGVGSLAMGILTHEVDLRAAIAAQVDNRNAKLLANPVVVTVENQKAMINIADEIPYQESRQSLTGPPMVSTAFKDIGIVLEVTPRVSHDDHIIAKVMAKQSRQSGTSATGVPIEAKRTTETTLRTKNGQTIFIGGLRRYDDIKQTNKIPVLGDIPIVNFMFRNNAIDKKTSELLIFLTCNVMPEEIPPLGVEMQKTYDELNNTSRRPNAQRELGRSIVMPWRKEDPEWRLRRSDK